MARKSAKNLGKSLPENLRYLSSMIARKSENHTSKWATSIDESFLFYTRTSEINFLQSLNESLAKHNWPFPGYLNLQKHDKVMDMEWKYSHWYWLIHPVYFYTGPSLMAVLFEYEFAQVDELDKCDKYMIFFFRRNNKPLFHMLENSPILKSKSHIVYEIEKTYEMKLWAACINLILSLLDYVIRIFSETDDLHMSIQVLRDALFNETNLRPKDLVPGTMAIANGKSAPEKGNTFASTVEEDLRLPGIYLSSFFEFADQYYEWYSSTISRPKSSLNRHAVMHCSSEYWSEANTIRMLTFLDLTLRLEKPLRVLIHDEI
ncbi:MAG: hypothetical protein ACYC0V_04075 [Armatimonadota bacterium]